MFDLIFGLRNIIRALAVCGLPIEHINPVVLKRKTRTDVSKPLGSLFLIGFLMVAVGKYYGTPQI